MKVWIAERGERDEGGSVVAVCRDKRKARRIALSQAACFNGGWRPHKSNSNEWTNGCDYVRIYRMEVQ